MKKIEISPEWVLDKLSITHQPDGKGNITICSDTVSDSHWIDLAFETLGVKYETRTVGYDPDPKKQYFEVQWEFKIEAVKEDCPNLYNKWSTMNDAHAYRLWVAQQLIDSIEVKEIVKSSDAEQQNETGL